MRTTPEKKMSLLTENEAQLVLASAPRNLMELSRRELRGRIQRARRLMDKYDGLATRQRREALGRRTPTRSKRAEGNANTRRKATYFRQALMRFEKRLAMLDRQEAMMAKRARVTRKATGARRTTRAAGGSTRRTRTATRTTGGARRTRTGTATRAVGGRKPVRRMSAAGRTATGSVREMKAQRRKGGARKQQGFSSMRRASHVQGRNRRTQARKDSRR
ncbi:hypothetical protein OWM54_23450 [Myxococcus sp. MISCRS1]|uniref:hypothetical protein n=1 Tax=Myxococcus TaxID=32 RepID=UPI001CBCAA41|nr:MULTISPECIES: hypothetical protein [unclassified Myxococcus]MBZ4398434.1 hypothetical protein [Myxococcus sp. AS-1-15]MBZ4412665.1 hypothetical protein [Myxococcus sp. XM-1-1-1]MCY1000098.1 hypothetical protein [Myxococcus sp. MISCRS1]